jgi:hypothetical protein
MIARLHAEFEQATALNPESNHARRLAADLAHARREAARAVPRILAPHLAPKPAELPAHDETGHAGATPRADELGGGSLRSR